MRSKLLMMVALIMCGIAAKATTVVFYQDTSNQQRYVKIAPKVFYKQDMTSMDTAPAFMRSC